MCKLSEILSTATFSLFVEVEVDYILHTPVKYTVSDFYRADLEN